MPMRNYREELMENIADLDEAAHYLTACYEESEEVFLLGLRQVVEAHGGVGALAERSGLNRESLYKLLSEEGNPRLSSLAAIFDALGLKLSFATSSGDQDEAA